MTGGWIFVAAAYAVGIVATGAITLASFLAMRRAEARADALSRR